MGECCSKACTPGSLDRFSRMPVKRTVDLNGYDHKKELIYNDMNVKWEIDGCLRITIIAKSNGKKWMQLYKSYDFDEDLQEVQQRLNDANNITAYMYKEDEDDYPLLIDVNEGGFYILLSRKGDKSKYDVTNTDKHNLILL